ncbi:hypothetical protein PN417_09875 [Halorubrum ezzemoulense]|jgi:hypothetical protein|uniref:hypothetical protein n=1 Tax=Halorubrum ezzemoulense TaxID=337243 RepID=UPI00232B1118|nr:hypothetical protein [Halorubrum ezzemoulense]MDB9301242.1 hypothetical protein [Halorubrum ezzemoulense]
MDLDDLEGLVALDDRTVTTTGSSALVSIPSAKSLGLVDKQSATASVSVRRLDGEVVVTARIALD